MATNIVHDYNYPQMGDTETLTQDVRSALAVMQVPIERPKGYVVSFWLSEWP
jgi:hypothetical protein